MPAGYSGTPLPKKLGIKEGHIVAVVNGPSHLAELLVPLPEGVVVRTGARGKPDVSLVFVETQAQLRKRLPQLWTPVDDDWSGLKLMVRRELR